MAHLVTVFGGSGFVGRYVAREMAQRGWRVRVAVRRPNEALFVRPYGTPGQVEPILCNIRDDASVAAALAGSDAVVNCVGILAEVGKNSFGLVQHHGAERIAREAARAGIRRFVHLSAIGADSRSPSVYAETKALGEAGVLEHMPRAVILRPSIIFGPEDQFFNRFAGMAMFSPALPLVGPNTRFQPVYVQDVALAAAKAAVGEARPGIYELGGPEVRTFRELMVEMLAVIRRRRLVIAIPFPIAMVLAGALDLLQALTLGLFRNGMITRDQVRNLRRDNVVTPGIMGLAELGIEPTAMGPVLREYLWRYRPSGQYADIKESARHMRP